MCPIKSILINDELNSEGFIKHATSKIEGQNLYIRKFFATILVTWPGFSVELRICQWHTLERKPEHTKGCPEYDTKLNPVFKNYYY